jgi:prepilin-type N-terminal cleavage/methylation domain-containing protein
MYKKSKKQYNKGFTLMEMLVVIGIIGLVGSLALFLDFNSFRGNAFRSEINTLVISLQTARADALNNIHQKKHGVAIFPGGYDGYVVFEGDSYALRDTSRDENINISYNISFDSSAPGEIVFDQLSGNSNYDGDIVVKDTPRNFTAKISINHEGKISW